MAAASPPGVTDRASWAGCHGKCHEMSCFVAIRPFRPGPAAPGIRFSRSAVPASKLIQTGLYTMFFLHPNSLSGTHRNAGPGGNRPVLARRVPPAEGMALFI